MNVIGWLKGKIVTEFEWMVESEFQHFVLALVYESKGVICKSRNWQRGLIAVLINSMLDRFYRKSLLDTWWTKINYSSYWSRVEASRCTFWSVCLPIVKSHKVFFHPKIKRNLQRLYLLLFNDNGLITGGGFSIIIRIQKLYIETQL